MANLKSVIIIFFLAILSLGIDACTPGQAKDWETDYRAKDLKSPSWPWKCQQNLGWAKGDTYEGITRALNLTMNKLHYWNCFLSYKEPNLKPNQSICVDATFDMVDPDAPFTKMKTNSTRKAPKNTVRSQDMEGLIDKDGGEGILDFITSNIPMSFSFPTSHHQTQPIDKAIDKPNQGVKHYWTTYSTAAGAPVTEQPRPTVSRSFNVLGFTDGNTTLPTSLVIIPIDDDDESSASTASSAMTSIDDNDSSSLAFTTPMSSAATGNSTTLTVESLGFSTVNTDYKGHGSSSTEVALSWGNGPTARTTATTTSTVTETTTTAIPYGMPLSRPQNTAGSFQFNFTEPCGSDSPQAEDCRVTLDCDTSLLQYPTCVEGTCRCAAMPCSQKSTCAGHHQCREDYEQPACMPEPYLYLAPEGICQCALKETGCLFADNPHQECYNTIRCEEKRFSLYPEFPQCVTSNGKLASTRGHCTCQPMACRWTNDQKTDGAACADLITCEQGMRPHCTNKFGPDKLRKDDGYCTCGSLAMNETLVGI